MRAWRPAWLVWLHLRQLNRNRVRALLAALSLAAGAAVLVAVSIEVTSIRAATAEVASELSGPAELRVVGATPRGGITPETLGLIRGTEGVAGAVPLVTALTRLVDEDGHERTVVVVGCTPGLSSTGLVCPTADGGPSPRLPVRVPPALEEVIADGTSLRTNVGRQALEVVEVDPRLERFDGVDVVLAPLAEAQRVFERGDRVDTVYIATVEASDRSTVIDDLRATVEGRGVVLAEGQATPAPDVATALLPLFGLVGLFSMVAGGLLVFSVTQLTLAERQVSLAIEEAIGATHRQVRVGVAVETGVLGALGGVLGTLMGVALSYPMLDGVSALLEDLAGVQAVPVIEPWVAVAPILLSVVVASVSGFLAAVRSTSTDLASRFGVLAPRAPRASATGWVLLTAGALGGALVCRAASEGGGLDTWQSLASPVGLVVALVGTVGLAARLAGLGLEGLGHAVPFGPGVARLGARESRMARRRAPAVALVVVVVVVLGGVLLGIANGSRAEFTAMRDDQVLITSLSPFSTANVDAQIPTSAVEALDALPGIGPGARSSVLTVARTATEFVLVTANDPEALADRPVVAGDDPEAVLRRGEVIIGSGLARQLDLRPGGEMRLPALDGYATFRVGAVWNDIEAGGLALTMDFSLAERTWGGQPVQQVLVRPEGHRSLTDADLRAGTGATDLSARSAAAFRQEVTSNFVDYLRPLWLLQRGLFGIVLVAVGIATYLAGLQRRRELGVMASIGLSPVGTARLLVVEEVLVAATAAAAGCLAVPVLLASIREASLFFIGAPLTFTTDWSGSVLQALGVVVVCGAVASLPAVLVARHDIADSLRDHSE